MRWDQSVKILNFISTFKVPILQIIPCAQIFTLSERRNGAPDRNTQDLNLTPYFLPPLEEIVSPSPSLCVRSKKRKPKPP